MNDFLQLAGKTILVLGVANRKSVAWHAAQVLKEAGADVVYAVRSEARRESVQKLVGEAPVLVCDVEHEDQIAKLRERLSEPPPQAARHAALDRLCRLRRFDRIERRIEAVSSKPPSKHSCGRSTSPAIR